MSVLRAQEGNCFRIAADIGCSVVFAKASDWVFIAIRFDDEQVGLDSFSARACSVDQRRQLYI